MTGFVCRYVYSVEYTTDSQQPSTEPDRLWKIVQEEGDKNKEVILILRKLEDGEVC